MDKITELPEIVLLALIFTGIGVLCFWLCFYFRRRTRRFISEALQTDGDVIGLHEVYDGGSATYAPVIRFTTAHGVVREFTDSVSSRPAGYNVGDRVRILYHRHDPRDARVATTFRLYLSSIIFGLIGTIFLGVGIVLTMSHLFFREG